MDVNFDTFSMNHNPVILNPMGFLFIKIELFFHQ